MTEIKELSPEEILAECDRRISTGDNDPALVAARNAIAQYVALWKDLS